WNYSYTPKSAPDRFSVQVVPSVWGFSYVIQFVVTWYDPSNHGSFVTKSSAYAAFFPAGGGLDALGGNAWSFREEQIGTWAKALGQPVLLEAARSDPEPAR
ncbi:MAG TPA: hypothetical protein VER11_20055, partial [Polyangiaceae bacterium]|nr:hypothetical protein [Polyangiaceae bacterium]